MKSGIAAHLIDSETGAREAHRRERSLVQRATRGDASACREIVEQHSAGMYSRALRMVRDRSEAEDLVQESFARAFGRLRQFDSTYRLSTWLYRIVVNSCRDHMKSPRRKEQPSGQHQLEQCTRSWNDDPLIARERRRRLQRALDSLRPNYSEIVMLKDVMELSFEEIHALTGTPITGLKIRAVRARDRLRKLLAEPAIKAE
jgi:RNA polymerase sigma-70 factor (ECF subfamily)